MIKKEVKFIRFILVLFLIPHFNKPQLNSETTLYGKHQRAVQINSDIEQLAALTRGSRHGDKQFRFTTGNSYVIFTLLRKWAETGVFRLIP